MKKSLVALLIVGVLLSPAGAWAGGYGRHHHGHHHKGHHAEYLALGILGGVLGGIALGHAISDHAHYPPPPPVYVPRHVYYGPAYPVHRHHRHCHH